MKEHSSKCLPITLLNFIQSFKDLGGPNTCNEPWSSEKESQACKIGESNFHVIPAINLIYCHFAKEKYSSAWYRK